MFLKHLAYIVKRDRISNALLCFHTTVGIIIGQCENKICNVLQITILSYACIFRMLFLIFFPNFQIYGGCFSEDGCWYRCMVQRVVNNEKAGVFFFLSHELYQFYLQDDRNKCNSSSFRNFV